MTHTIKKTITALCLMILGSILLYNCEPDPDSLGEQLFLNGAAQGKEEAFPVIAYNIDNNDTIRTDAAKLAYGVLGAFDESQFGMQKASYLTQVKLSTYDPDFGTNAQVDSVVLVIKPRFASDSVTTNTVDDNYTYTTAADGAVNAKKVVNTYPALKFGKAKRNLTIKVHEVTTFLKSASDTVKSNASFEFDNTRELGSKVFNGNVSSVAITKDDGGTALFTASTPGIRIPLDKQFFQDKIIAKKDQPELSDASNFIRYLKGLRISVAENDGYLFQFSPNDMEMIMYYKYETTGSTTKTQTSYSFVMGSGNAHIGQYQYLRDNSFKSKLASNMRLYTQGMGGPSIGIKIPESTIIDLKNSYENEKAGIISAKIRLYIDPQWYKTNYPKPSEFTLLRKYVDPSTTGATKVRAGFTNDLLKLGGIPGFTIFKAYDNEANDKHYYDFTVTQSIKEMIEPNSKLETDKTETKYLKIDLGSFEKSPDGTSLVGYKSTTTPYNTTRAVFIGDASNLDNPDRVQLIVTYGTK
ncbi:protein of unknown function [Chryseobacterium taichungense]|uniref:DUF4270 domain-containing protein n=1 Tax=Chryseobacterium taichungense TaxID=295069 RepID=A0A1H8ACV3_9FLAO|nr:DUF4270 family protein [Chryseobacterium taichungense]SEM67387.1 protein of unknown function [Chryseobacterium taichungense]